jgi:hypothetical protein
MSNVNGLVVPNISSLERTRRRAASCHELIAGTRADNGSYIDAHPHGAGHEAAGALINTAQERFPGYQLRLASGIEAITAT